MGQDNQDKEVKGIQVVVRVRPLNPREREEGHRVCVHFDEPTKQVVLSAVDRTTLYQLKGATARGYAFDKRFGQDQTSESIYQDVIQDLITNVFKGYNATVLAYGQTGSGKTHTMSGGVGIHGIPEQGVIRQAICQLFNIIASIKRKMKPGEQIEVKVGALEIYNEDLRDLSQFTQSADNSGRSWGNNNNQKLGNLSIKDKQGPQGQTMTEVSGLHEEVVETADAMLEFLQNCEKNRSTSSTKLNDRSSRSHAIYTVQVNRVIVELLDELDDQMKAKVRQQSVSSKLQLVDLAGSERVKRSGVSGKELKEASHINSGLLALGNVIVALSEEQQHIPYRSSKLTRLLSDSLGGSSLTALITCISPSEMDFEETNNTLKYANRACKIKNTPLANKYIMLEEDLLPAVPLQEGGGVGMVAMSQLLDDHMKAKENKLKRDQERQDRQRKQQEALSSAKDAQMKIRGIQRLRAAEYARKLKERQIQGKTTFRADETIASFDPNFERKVRPKPPPKVVSKVSGDAAGQFDFNKWMSAAQERSDDGTKQESIVAVEDVGTEEDISNLPEMTDEEYQQYKEELEAEEREKLEADIDEGDDGKLVDIRQKYGLEDPETGNTTHRRSDMSEEVGSTGDGGDTETVPDTTRTEVSAKPIPEQSTAPASLIETEEVKSTEQDLSTSALHASSGTVAQVTQSSVESTATVIKSEVVQQEKPKKRSSRKPHKPRLLARFKVNKFDTISVFRAMSKEDFRDVVKLLPDNTPLPASDKMTYLIARLELARGWDVNERLQMVADKRKSMTEAIGPAVGCLMATFGTNMISSCIFDFEDPQDLDDYSVEERIELWGLQIPHNSVRPTLQDAEGVEGDSEEVKEAKDGSKDGKEGGKEAEGEDGNQMISWTSIDRLNMSVGLLYALCNYAEEQNVSCGFCVPRPQLLRRWQQAGVRMRQVIGDLALIYPKHAHDYEYYKSSTVAFFLVEDVQEGLERVLSLMPPFDKMQK